MSGLNKDIQDNYAIKQLSGQKTALLPRLKALSQKYSYKNVLIFLFSTNFININR